jgi:predicted O-linked N-acetylglucosamine transferase (SPINDLY family)
MQYKELVAQSADEYIALVIKLGQDAAYLRKVRSTLAEKSGVIFEDPCAVESLANCFESLNCGRPVNG